MNGTILTYQDITLPKVSSHEMNDVQEGHNYLRIFQVILFSIACSIFTVLTSSCCGHPYVHQSQYILWNNYFVFIDLSSCVQHLECFENLDAKSK